MVESLRNKSNPKDSVSSHGIPSWYARPARKLVKRGCIRGGGGGGGGDIVHYGGHPALGQNVRGDILPSDTGFGAPGTGRTPLYHSFVTLVFCLFICNWSFVRPSIWFLYIAARLD